MAGKRLTRYLPERVAFTSVFEKTTGYAGLFTNTVMLIAKPELRTLIPHTGSMCLLDGVLHWDDAHIVCISTSHRDPAQPLRRGQQLAAVHGCEYAAQALAVHGGLRARAAARHAPPAYLAALRSVCCYTDRLDIHPDPLTIRAWRRLEQAGNVIYDTELHAADILLLTARITVMVQPA